MIRVSVGFFIRRIARDAHALRGKTFSAYAHTLHSSRERAEAALEDLATRRSLDRRFDYDVAEAFMILDEEAP